MTVTVIVRPRLGVVSSATQEFSWEATVNGDVILARSRTEAEALAQAREKILKEFQTALDKLPVIS